jgi:hypothetical protein
MKQGVSKMNDYISSQEKIHIPTNMKVKNANKILQEHPEYNRIEGTLFVSGTMSKEGSQKLNYQCPQDFTKEQIDLAESIVNSLPSLV